MSGGLLVRERELNHAYNRGLRTALYLLRKSEHLDPEGRRHLVRALEQEIAESEFECTLDLLLHRPINPDCS